MEPHKSLMHHDIQKFIFYHNFHLFLPICDRKDFEKISLLSKLQISPWPLAPFSLDLYDLADKIGSLFMFMFNNFSVRTLQCTYILLLFFFYSWKDELKKTFAKLQKVFLLTYCQICRVCPESFKNSNAWIMSFGQAVECWN